MKLTPFFAGMASVFNLGSSIPPPTMGSIEDDWRAVGAHIRGAMLSFRTESPIERDEEDEVEYPQPEIV